MAVRRSSGLMFLIVPLLLVPFALYNMLAFMLDVEFQDQRTIGTV